MDIDYLIIGQGICGSFLSMKLQKANQSFMVIDDASPNTASKIASGIINPVTGRRIVKTWLIDELMPFAWNAYKEAEKTLGIECIKESRIIDFFTTPQMRLAFLERFAVDGQYLSIPDDSTDWNTYLNYDFGYGSIYPSFLVDLQKLLQAFRNTLVQNEQLSEAHFDQEDIRITEKGIQYKDINARKIIFCDGSKNVENRWFKNLPFAPNKGEALIVEIPGLPAEQEGLRSGDGGEPLQNILKKGINIVPWKDELFWVGSSNEWQFENDQPTKLFRERTMAQLKGFCKLPFKVVDHWAAVRPATVERRPFLGFHPRDTQIGIFNGMGTKGCSLAPFFAHQFVRHLTTGSPLMPEADVYRFRKVISR